MTKREAKRLAKLERLAELVDNLLPYMYDADVMARGAETDFERWVRDIVRLLRWKYHRPVPHPDAPMKGTK